MNKLNYIDIKIDNKITTEVFRIDVNLHIDYIRAQLTRNKELHWNWFNNKTQLYDKYGIEIRVFTSFRINKEIIGISINDKLFKGSVKLNFDDNTIIDYADYKILHNTISKRYIDEKDWVNHKLDNFDNIDSLILTYHSEKENHNEIVIIRNIIYNTQES